jgi:hypothetical protein
MGPKLQLGRSKKFWCTVSKNQKKVFWKFSPKKKKMINV